MVLMKSKACARLPAGATAAERAGLDPPPPGRGTTMPGKTFHPECLARADTGQEW